MSGDVFLDAAFWIALRDAREPYHTQARELTKKLLDQRCGFIFTSFVLAEVYAYFSRSLRLRLQILDDAQKNPVMRWEPVSPQDETAAIQILQQHRDKNFSFCDAVSFAMMRRLQTRRAASFDIHFRQIGGWEVLGLDIQAGDL